MPLKQIYEDLMGEHSLHVIRAAIALLIDLGFLQRRHNPGNGQDKTYQYQLQLEAIETELSETRTVAEESPRCETESSEFNGEKCIETQLPNTEIKSTLQVSEKNVELEQAEQILDKYEERLKTFGIYRTSWSGPDKIKNPRMVPIISALNKISRERAERSIEGFLGWIKDAKNIEDMYKVFCAAIWRG